MALINPGSTLTLSLGERSYPIHIGPGLLSRGELIARDLAQPKAVIITNTVVAPLYLDTLRCGLEKQKVAADAIVLQDGEKHKNWLTLNQVFDELLELRAERKTTLIALGGGVIGDLAGFAAAIFQRGTPFIQIPTTLLAQVDSSVGGKTAINHPLGKNMIGTFYQPRAVLADTDTLRTLPDRELSAGIAEVIKYGLIGDLEFFDWLESNMDKLIARDSEVLTYAIERSCRNKAAIVARDEREEGVRALLNFGHTFGHAIESGLGYGQWLHGEAVAAGMVIATHVSRQMGLVSAEAAERTVSLLRRARLPVQGPPLGLDRYLDLMGHDKKVEGGKIRYVLLKNIGEAFISSAVPPDVLAKVLTGEGVGAA
ncbi:MAG: 3-dehydroquinate synthase [Betaproteobacteria bacterium]|nr:3-dehydroquinate synthase [Betaproteobacteria bacterium]MDH4293296.1 3-dehydroquinate synthase [Betaproteobacteria bacterium]MDH5342090.1 3-dehydroquinate synthase [Betaproteobacteria bacterium]